MAAIIEVEYYNSLWLKRVLTPETALNNTEDLSTKPVVPGGSGTSPRRGVFPLSNVYASPQTFNITTEYPGSDTTIPNNRSVTIENFYLEDMYIKGGFNNTPMDYGARAFLDREEPVQQDRFAALIYSGVFNSRTGVNRTNEFPIGDQITKSANPDNGSIQKLYAEENNLLVLQENKCNRALIDKDAIYSAEGGGTVTTQNAVIGQIVPYAGEYGISRNPESFAIYGFRKYFADRNRSAILRLSHDGITEISEYGMRDWFRDNLETLEDNIVNEFKISFEKSKIVQNESFFCVENSTPQLLGELALGGYVYQESTGIGLGYITEIDLNPAVPVTGYPVQIQLDRAISLASGVYATGDLKIIYYNRSYIKGGWDIYNKQYVLSLQYNNQGKDQEDDTFYTLGFDELTKGWTSFYTYRFEQLGSLKGKVYTTYNKRFALPNAGNLGYSGLWIQYSNNVNRGNFYSIDNPSTVTFIANPNPSVQKNFLTIDYEGNSGWKVVAISSDETGFDKEWSGGVPLGTWKLYYDTTNLIRSYYEGQYDGAGNTGATASPLNPPLLHAGFDRKENRYVANLVNNSNAMPGEIQFGDQMSGIKGFFSEVKMSTDTSTDPGGFKELYTVGLRYNVSSM
jgi:hypothetical protein